MNYNEFMKVVDGKLSSMSEMEKTEWIHNMARTLKEQERIASDTGQGYGRVE